VAEASGGVGDSSSLEADSRKPQPPYKKDKNSLIVSPASLIIALSVPLGIS
jgi:hypothetical protein